MDRGAWRAVIHRVAKELDMTERLKNKRGREEEKKKRTEYEFIFYCFHNILP